MNNDFRKRLSFSGSSTAHRENWREALALLPDVDRIRKQSQKAASLSINLPIQSDPDGKALHIEWVITENSHSMRVILSPHVVEGDHIYRTPSLKHLLSHLTLTAFDHEWIVFLSTHFSHDDTNIELEINAPIQFILMTLARANRLRFASDGNPIQVAGPLQLKAQLRFSDEWNLWALDAVLITEMGEIMLLASLDFISCAGLAIYDGKLFPLPTGAAWVAQLLESGAWYIAKEHLGEALYGLSHRIQDSEFLRDLPNITCAKSTPVPVVYLRPKQSDQHAHVNLYLAYRYGTHEIFSVWHSQEERDVPIYFESTVTACVLYFRDFTKESETELFIKQAEDVVFLVKKRIWSSPISALWPLIHQLLRQGWEIWAEKHKLEELSSFGVSTQSGIGWFELQSFDRNSAQPIDPIQLIKYLKRKALFIQLGHGRVCVLPERWIARLSQFLDIGQTDDPSGWRFSSIYAPEVEGILGSEQTFQPDPVFQANIEKIRSFNHVQPLPQPEGLRVMLRPYQLTGLTWLNLLCELQVGGILADDMGLGKTVQILALLQHRIINQPCLAPQTILVVCPKSVQAHWLAQIKNLTPCLSCHLLTARDLSANLRPATQHRLLLTSYGFIRHRIKVLSAWTFDLLILDEAQMIKNESSQTTQAIKQLSATLRFALTGTPIENRFDELVSIFTFLNPHAQLNLGTNLPTAEAVRELVQRALHPFVLRRLKEDVLTLPPKTVNEIVLPMDPTQGRLYQELAGIYRNEITKQQDDHALPTEDEFAFFIEGLMRLRQVATHPKQLTNDEFGNCPSNKLIYLCEQLPILIERGHRIVVFSQFLGFLRNLSKEMDTLMIRHSYVDGTTPERQREIALFQSNQSIKVLLISLRVGGVGIDLSSTDICIIADPWWNEAVENQAIDRLHRFGQKKEVIVWRLISEGSIEEKMDILKRNKSELANALGKTKADFLNHLKWEDFTKIF